MKDEIEKIMAKYSKKLTVDDEIVLADWLHDMQKKRYQDQNK